MSEIASTFKITYHGEKLRSYLRDEPIFPATLELDLTSACNRKCPDCPSTASLPCDTLEIGFVERLLARLAGQTRGLLLTGGEPTMAPTFSETLRMAQRYGFTDVVVVTNGTLLNEERTASALLKYASAIRVSMYDWSAESCGGVHGTLQRIETLRSRIDREGSQLQIGVSVLTTRENATALNAITREAAAAGAHWIYFHPLCTRWDTGSPVRVDQKDVLTGISEIQNVDRNGAGVFVFGDRYVESSVQFAGYHAAHFLLVVGADGMNYLGAEVKYHPQHIIADVAGNWDDDFLWQRPRLERIKAVSSTDYPAIGSRHRGVLYSDLIDLIAKRVQLGQKLSDESLSASEDRFRFPHIL